MPRRERWEAEMAQRVVALRDERGLTQDDLARASGVSIWTLRRWEQKGHTPLLGAVVKVADALGVSLDELIGRTPPAAKKKGAK
jgi:transcriptional regulator with XRE-family HTH domain